MDRNPRKRPADTQESAWIAGEDQFVLQQAKRKAEIRVRESRARPVDWLAVTLRFIDPSRTSKTSYDYDDGADFDLDAVDPEAVFEELNVRGLEDLEKDIDVFLTLEKEDVAIDFWHTMMVICKDRKSVLVGEIARGGRGVESVSSDVDRLMGKKSLDELDSLEKQIKFKLRSDGDIDTDYWEHLLRSLTSWKAKAKLRKVSRSIVETQTQAHRAQQAQEAERLCEKVSSLLKNDARSQMDRVFPSESQQAIDPKPMLKIRAEDRGVQIHDESAFLQRVREERKKVLRLGYVPAKRKPEKQSVASAHKVSDTSNQSGTSTTAKRNDDFSQAATALYERELGKGVGENEEIFAGEEEVPSAKPWMNKYKPRKPRYFNRVQMGYEWNKYNQTHYDHDNPPPRVVHGYKFNIFYPDLLDRSRAPTYKIEREHGRKRGQSFAAAGEEDTCLIRFISGPPYEDIAFRIVDKEWDYSAKRERGFKSSFEKGILQLHFQFKKVSFADCLTYSRTDADCHRFSTGSDHTIIVSAKCERYSRPLSGPLKTSSRRHFCGAGFLVAFLDGFYA